MRCCTVKIIHFLFSVVYAIVLTWLVTWYSTCLRKRPFFSGMISICMVSFPNSLVNVCETVRGSSWVGCIFRDLRSFGSPSVGLGNSVQSKIWQWVRHKYDTTKTFNIVPLPEEVWSLRTDPLRVMHKLHHTESVKPNNKITNNSKAKSWPTNGLQHNVSQRLWNEVLLRQHSLTLMTDITFPQHNIQHSLPFLSQLLFRIFWNRNTFLFLIHTGNLLINGCNYTRFCQLAKMAFYCKITFTIGKNKQDHSINT